MNMADGNRPSVTDRVSEAADWLVRLQEDSVTEAEIAAWLKWCAADSLNLEAFERVQQLYDQLQSLPSAKKQEFLRLQRAIVTNDPVSAGWRPMDWFKERAWTLGAGALAASMTVVVLLMSYNRTPAVETVVYQAPRGFQQTVLLADRSRVTLASSSKVLSHFTADHRYIDLREGEAYFEVQHDRARPFVVKAGAITVTAVGTKFNVRRTGLRTIVAVTEGAVDVTTDKDRILSNTDQLQDGGNDLTMPVRVRAGQQAIEVPEQHGLAVSDANLGMATGWQQGRLEYVMEPLKSVVADVNRYAAHPVVISDPRVGDLVFTGTVFIDRIDDWAMTLPGAFPITSLVAADGTVMLKFRSDDKRNDFR
ncbi:MAG: FecR domain-containing protein [Steroidobacteraceae bacterium]